MQLTQISVSVLFLLPISSRSSTIATNHTSPSTPCLTAAHARRVAENFAALIRAYSTDAATAYLTPDFTDYSDSVNELINAGCPAGAQPLGTATFTSRAAFDAGQGAQPQIPFAILGVWHACDAVTLRWRSARPAGLNSSTLSASSLSGSSSTAFSRDVTEEVTGIAVLETVFEGWGRNTSTNASGNASRHVARDLSQPFRIHTVYSEFNSAAWLLDSGTFTPSCVAMNSSAGVGNGTSSMGNSSSPTRRGTTSAKVAKWNRVRLAI